jgi:ankyrin repeat protein
MLIRLVSFLLIELHLNYLDIHHNDESNAMSTDLTTIEQTTGESKLRSVQLHKRTDDRSPDYYDRVLAIAYRNNIERMLDPRVSKSASKLARQIFSILLAATRLLTIEELQHTICAIQDPIDSSIYSAPLRWSAIQQTCRGMIVKDSAEFVTFLHDSLATFVDRDPKLAEIFSDRQEVMSLACFRYLASTEFSQGVCNTALGLQERLKKWSFLTYAGHNWKTHFGNKRHGILCTDRCNFAAIFLGHDSNVEAAYQVQMTEDELMNRIFTRMITSPGGEKLLLKRFILRTVISEGTQKIVVRSILDQNRKSGLHWACELGCPVLVNKLSATTQDFDRCDWTSNSPLHYAAERGNFQNVRTLLEHGAAPDLRDVRGMTPLACASQLGHTEIVHALLRLGKEVDPNSVCELAETDYLEHSVPWDNGRPNFDGIVTMKLIGGRTPLHHAARDGHVETARLLLADKRTDVNHFDEDGFTPLHRAAKKGQLAMVELLNGHPDVDTTRRVSERTKGVYDQADVFQHSGETFLHLASRYARPWNHEVVKYTIEEHPHLINTLDGTGTTPLHRAVEGRAANNVQAFLREPSTDPNIQNSSMHSALHLAVISAMYSGGEDALDIVRHLVQLERTNPNSQDSGMCTPLHYAVQMQDTTLVKLLLTAADIRVDLRDDSGVTPLGRALTLRNEATFQCIYENERWGPGHWAVGEYIGGHREIRHTEEDGLFGLRPVRDLLRPRNVLTE